MRTFWFLVFWEALLHSASLEAAACCSGGASLPSLILDNAPWVLRLNTTQSFVVGDSQPDGTTIWREDVLDERLLSFVPSGIFKINDQWQASIRMPLRQRSLQDDTAWGLGDLGMSASFEPLLMDGFSRRQPRFFLLATVTAPTGEAAYDSDNSNLYSFGSGFWTASLGAAIQKTFVDWDLILNSEVRYSFSRDFKNESVEPGWIFSGAFGFGYSFLNYRAGLSVGPTFEQEKNFVRAHRRGPSKLVWDTQLDISARLLKQWAILFSYLDQTLWGPTQNVALERRLGLGLSYRGI